jgi:peptidyl-prolyl cis-trans isomerase B (cyclophilin B)|uniref:peptidylprolyl isomerase n=1 Tax=Candidatus Nanopelagicus sp. TaxID=2518620 RepID=UPI00404A45C2
MQKVVKVIATSTLLTICSIYFPAIASAAPTKKPMPVICKPTTAKVHTVKNIIPPEVKPPFRNRTFTFMTNCGHIVIQANAKSAPITVTALAALVNGGFYNKSLCHRLTTNEIYVLQCGDPTGTGMGGPNFSYRDENLPQAVQANYPAGTVAMANSGANTNGSQFFIVYENTSMNPNYTIWGRVTKGLEIVRAIAKVGVADGSTDGTPKQTIAIERVRVR